MRMSLREDLGFFGVLGSIWILPKGRKMPRFPTDGCDMRTQTN